MRRLLLLASLAMACFAWSATAHAIAIGGPGFFVDVPVYLGTPPVYVAPPPPPPVYVAPAPPVYVAPAPVYVGPPPVGPRPFWRHHHYHYYHY